MLLRTFTRTINGGHGETVMCVHTVYIILHVLDLQLQQTAIIDIMSAFPRSLFSESELDAARWFAEKLGVGRSLPSVREVKIHRDMVMATAGVRSTMYKSAHGNLYTFNDLSEIIAHVCPI